MNKSVRWILAVCFLLASSIPTLSLTVEEIPDPLTTKNSHFMDMAGVITDRTEADLDKMLFALEASNGTQVAVVAVEEIDGRTPKAFATSLFNYWGIGQKGVDNGVLVLLVMKSRRIEIEVGDGANRFLTDGRCDQILQGQAVPYFKRSQYSEGLSQVVRSICKELDGVDYRSPTQQARSTSSSSSHSLAQSPPKKHPSKRHRPIDAGPRRSSHTVNLDWMVWGVGGGGLLGGLVATRSYFRRKPRKCRCGQMMTRLSEREEDQYLNSGQQAEELVSSVDYDVWHCKACGEQQVERYRSWFTGMQTCPSCSYRTLSVSKHTVDSPTTYREGRGRREESCRHCRHHRVSHYSIARLPEPSSSDSSSSSSSSSSEWGGGSSHGGGSGASW